MKKQTMQITAFFILMFTACFELPLVWSWLYIVPLSIAGYLIYRSNKN